MSDAYVFRRCEVVRLVISRLLFRFRLMASFCFLKHFCFFFPGYFACFDIFFGLLFSSFCFLAFVYEVKLRLCVTLVLSTLLPGIYSGFLLSKHFLKVVVIMGELSSGRIFELEATL